jgi:hypothetical protein
MCLYNKYRKVCPICLQEKKLTTKCNICTDTMICQDCCIGLCEQGLCSKCPVCRQPNWKQPKKTQILPKIILTFKSKQIEQKREKEQVVQEIDNGKKDCFDTFIHVKDTIYMICVLMTVCLLIYVVGMFTIFLFSPGLEWSKHGELFWLSAIVGLAWAVLIWSPCCCGKTLYNVYCKRTSD